jgi:hypothetical protein
MRVLTNIPRLAGEWRTSDGQHGLGMVATSLGGFVDKLDEADLILINCDPGLVLRLALLFTVQPSRRRPLVASDLVLRRPETVVEWLGLGMKRQLLKRVDHFIHHFKDLGPYQHYFGIGPERSSFVPFKPNLRYRPGTDGVEELAPAPEGQYVLCFGWSMRDFDTFFAAVETLPYPAAIVEPDFAKLRIHRSRFTRKLDDLPKQVRVLKHDPSSSYSQIEILRGAKLVVLPMLKSCLVGVGTALNAMLLGKCVIMTEGPQTNGLYSGELLTAKPEDSSSLAAAIDRAWQDDALRLRVASAGQLYARGLGGAPELVQRILDQSIAWYGQTAIPGR